MKILHKESNNQFDITTKKFTGEELMVCPVCSHLRKPKNQKTKVFSWNHDKNQGYCSHCQASFFIPKQIVEKKQYSKPEWNNNTELTDKAVKYFESRKISQFVLRKLKITSGIDWMPQFEREIETIHFNYFDNDELINIKYRGAQKSFKIYKDAKLIFYNIDNIKNEKEAIIVEGEFDCLAFCECGKFNTISVPNGAKNFQFLDNCIDDLNHLEKIYIAVDNDESGIELRKELIRRIGSERCFIVDFGDLKDANDVLIHKGKLELLKCLESAKEIPLSGVQFVSDVFDEMLNSFRFGKELGTTTHLNSLDDRWKWRKGEVTIWTGYMNEGKSCFLSQLCILKAKFDGWKFAIFCPENYPISEYYDELIHCYVGKSTDKSYRNVMSENEYIDASKFIHNHFFAILPENEFYIDTILDRMKHLIRKYGVNACIIDPYNQVEHLMEKSQREDLYISKFMTTLKRYAIDNNVSFHLVAHQVTPAFHGKEDYPQPDGYKIKGGGTFADKADNVISVWRPYRKSDPKDSTVRIISNKIKKQKLVGTPGEVDLFYDVSRNQYRCTLEHIEDMLPTINQENVDIEYHETISNFESETKELDLTPIKESDLLF